MRASLLLVHGVGPVRDSASERATWVSALLAGARSAGHTAAADALERSIDERVRFAHYADLFFRGQAQGTGISPALDDGALMAELLGEAVRMQEDQERDPADRALLEKVAYRLAPPGQSQGAGDIVRRLINGATTLLELPYLRRAGGWASGRALVGQLAQVSRYLARHPAEPGGPALDVAVRNRLHEVLADGPTVVLSHSLGTVVAFEALHERLHDVPLFVTLGSPLAMRSVVRPRLRPQPPSVPAGVGRWLNVWDRDDLIAARPLLEKDFRANPSGVLPLTRRVDSDGLWVHPAVKYLSQPHVAGPVMEALA